MIPFSKKVPKVSDICSEFTQKLESVEASQKQTEESLQKEIAEKQIALEKASEERTRASTAIGNIRSMFGVASDGE